MRHPIQASIHVPEADHLRYNFREQVARGEVASADAHAAIDTDATAAGPAEAEGDTSLSTYKGGGVAEAECLADYWSEILKVRT